MKLWLLKPRSDIADGVSPWSPWYDKAFGFVVRAKTEHDARMIADQNGGDETCDGEYDWNKENKCHPWIDARFSTCEELDSNGPSGVIIRDFAAA